MQREASVQGGQEPEAARAELGKLLTRWRTECGLSQTRLASKVNSNQPTISRWEKGQMLPSAEAIEAVWHVRSASERAHRLDEEELQQALLLRRRAEAEPKMSRPQEPSQPEPKAAQQAKKKWVWAAVATVCVAAIAAVVTVWATGDDNPAQAGEPGSTASALLFPTVAATATCAGATCASMEPATTICSKDAVTASVGRKYGATVELRYSPHCRAAWAKMSRTSPEDRILITPKKGNTEEYRQRTGHDAHTPMVPATRPQDAQACAHIQDRGTVCATTPVTATAAASPS
ncbi:DUF2690 domain-containing protein [Streptomyces sp. NBC_00154]|uniref:DUF2690 domain-containing protein n=1 Tax=Streptomyces sp. NBC_00154 TaxID=2975670 RepID=UPI00224CDE77|nr:DUF2690 domain-containing protein [Streptomyces sp. NBC_00154]MCX5315895.1 DUF2690 domain-containing protein [Streptomyces sp. NBC_00154]